MRPSSLSSRRACFSAHSYGPTSAFAQNVTVITTVVIATVPQLHGRASVLTAVCMCVCSRAACVTVIVNGGGARGVNAH